MASPEKKNSRCDVTNSVCTTLTLQVFTMVSKACIVILLLQTIDEEKGNVMFLLNYVVQEMGPLIRVL